MVTIKKERKVKKFFKRFGPYVIAGCLAFAIVLTGTVVGLTSNNNTSTPVNTNELIFALPMNNPNVIKDFSNTELQENVTLNQWEAHLSIDMSSADNLVYAVLDGRVTDVSYNYMEGHKIVIEHDGGFESVYSSLDENLLVKEGDMVVRGQNIAVASLSATSETDIGEHLHFTLLKDDIKIDPNLYIELQNK